jgi:hypothetical protein
MPQVEAYTTFLTPNVRITLRYHAGLGRLGGCCWKIKNYWRIKQCLMVFLISLITR